MIDQTRRSLLLGAGYATLASLTTTTSAAAAVAVPGEIRPLIDQERANILAVMARDEVPGTAVCLLYHGMPVWVEGFGVTGHKSRAQTGTDTMFSIQSTSKNFTATAIMMAVQRGLLDLDEPITAYLPGFKVQSRFEAAPQMKLTLRLLLSHRAGFTHEAPVGNNYDPAFPDFEAHIRSIANTWLRFPVAERYRYSNLGFDLAGYILQSVCAMPFAECLKTMIFDPLGMRDSTAATEVYARSNARAIGHQKGYDAVPLKTPLIASGGVYTSARDMAAYLALHLGRGRIGGKILLDEPLWDEMHGFSLGGDYGLGIIRTELRYGDTPLRMLGHRGGGFGFGCVCNYCPQADLAWVALFNRQTAAPYRFGETLLDGLLAQRHGARKPRLPAADLAPIRLRTAQLEQFAGNYLGRAASSTIQFERGVLGMQADSVFTPLRFTAPRTMITAGADDDAVIYEYHPATEAEEAHFECSIGEDSLDYNDGPHDAAGPNPPSWEAFLGRYFIEQWSRRTQDLLVHRKNGYLYLDDMRLLLEFEPGLFFTADGEALDFRQTPATWRNIRLNRAR